jgi:tripartite-type tricarboxylate transporter receptor subunit TctC
MPGAAGLKMAQYLFAVAPKDGTEIGALLNNAPVTELMEPGKHGFDSARFLWIGSVASPANVLAVWHTTGVKTIEDAKQKEVTIGSTTPGTTKEMFPQIANRLLGTKFKVINGYIGGAEINLAMERGEVGGHGANSWVSYQFQNAEWVRDHKINNIFQVTFQRDPAIADVPTLMELAQNDEQRKIILILTTGEAIGRPLAAPPGVSEAHVAVLRRAFDATMKDSAFLAEADKSGLEIGPTTGEKLQTMVAEMMVSPPDIVEKYKKAVASGQ